LASQTPFSGQRALVTGAGSGIGLATASALATRGADLVICDVNEERVQAAAEALRATGRSVSAEVLDVSDRAAMEDFAARINAEGALNILVNNAGVGVGGTTLETSLDDWEWVLGINLWGVIYGCRLFAPAMAEAGRGHVVNIASAAGLMGIPSLAAYSVTKCAVLALSEAMHAELAPSGVGVSVVCPGFLNTRIVADGRILGRLQGAPALERVERLMKRPGRQPEVVAEAIVAAIRRDRFLVPLFAEAHGLASARKLPASVVAFFRRRALAAVR
jgi:NAD(P)-dependent dehydrogenase (short-subunit alcohol dehydrogenase family)